MAIDTAELLFVGPTGRIQLSDGLCMTGRAKHRGSPLKKFNRQRAMRIMALGAPGEPQLLIMPLVAIETGGGIAMLFMTLGASQLITMRSGHSVHLVSNIGMAARADRSQVLQARQVLELRAVRSVAAGTILNSKMRAVGSIMTFCAIGDRFFGRRMFFVTGGAIQALLVTAAGQGKACGDLFVTVGAQCGIDPRLEPGRRRTMRHVTSAAIGGAHLFIVPLVTIEAGWDLRMLGMAGAAVQLGMQTRTFGQFLIRLPVASDTGRSHLANVSELDRLRLVRVVAIGAVPDAEMRVLRLVVAHGAFGDDVFARRMFKMAVGAGEAVLMATPPVLEGRRNLFVAGGAECKADPFLQL